MREVHSFLGPAALYHRFIKDFFKIELPLYKLLQEDATFDFNEKCQKTVDKLKEILTSTPVIQPPNYDLPFEIMCNVSDYDVFVMFEQRVEKFPHIIYYVSPTLNDLHYQERTFSNYICLT